LLESNKKVFSVYTKHGKMFGIRKTGGNFKNFATVTEFYEKFTPLFA